MYNYYFDKEDSIKTLLQEYENKLCSILGCVLYGEGPDVRKFIDESDSTHLYITEKTEIGYRKIKYRVDFEKGYLEGEIVVSEDKDEDWKLRFYITYSEYDGLMWKDTIYRELWKIWYEWTKKKPEKDITQERRCPPEEKYYHRVVLVSVSLLVVLVLILLRVLL